MKVDIQNDGRRYVLLEDYIYPVIGVKAPAGLVTDFASIPRWFWPVFPPTGHYQHAAVAHDRLCDLHNAGTDQIVTETPMGVVVQDFDHPVRTRRDIDRLFRVQMKLDGVGWRTRYTLWLAVRLYAIVKGIK